ncbi:hypothetical protein PoB_000521600 [Plakobranchus ocellatus]|uniref:Uncharacterized protein n=1 Tax=Plakobranchus ocellatus TaxID=259542 RepID=A0AAV3XUK2_9GAST|nr:hypothetical protein PoB_000521600 [Plakobranchus ocellatus]
MKEDCGLETGLQGLDFLSGSYERDAHQQYPDNPGSVRNLHHLEWKTSRKNKDPLGGPSIDGTRHAAHDLSSRAVPNAKTPPSIGHSTTSHCHNTSQPIMDSSDEDSLIMLTMLNNRKKKWIRN